MELQGFLGKFRSSVGALIAPCCDVGIMLIVPLGLAIRCLIFLTEVAAAGFIPITGVDAQQFSQLEVVGHAASFL
jgi:hypothetical protein